MTLAATGVVLPLGTRVKVAELTLAGSIGSEKVATTLTPTATPVVASAGSTFATSGAVVSAAAAIVKDQLLAAASGLPAASLAPVLTVAVYVVFVARSASG